LTVLVASGAEAGLRSSFKEVEALVVGAPIAAPEIFSVGRAEIRPVAGAELVPLLADGRLCGVIFDGAASWTYRVDDRMILPTVRHNLKEAKGLDVREAEGGLVLSGELKGAAIWGWDLDLGTVTLPETATPVEGAQAPEWLRTVFDKKLTGEPGRSLLASQRNGDDGYRWAVFQSGVGPLTLEVDPRPFRRLETLDRLVRPTQKWGPYEGGAYRTEGISALPVDRYWWEGPEVSFLSTRTVLKLQNSSGRQARVESTTDLQSMRDGLEVLSFSLRRAAWDENDKEYTNKVELVEIDGEKAEWTFRYGTLLVGLPKPLNKGESARLRVVTEGGMISRPLGDNYWRLVGGWYPVPTDGGVEWAEFDFTLEVPAPFVPIGAGEVLERTEQDGVERVRSKVAGPMNYGAAMAGKYKTVTDERNGFGVHISAYAFAKEKEAKKLSTVIHATKSCLESWLGVPYPFQNLQVVEIRSWGWGQAPPGVIFITQEAFNTAAKALVDQESRLFTSFASRGINERVAHEVAHGWFPHVAKTVAAEENWLSESLADYASAVCIEQTMADKKKGKKLFDRQVAEWKRLSKEAGDASSVFHATHLGFGDREDGFVYRALLYGRGPLVLHKIRQELGKKHGAEKGDNLFFAWLRSYIKNFDHKVAETRHLIAILNQVSGEDWQPFFERYIYGVESPDVG